MRTRSMMIAVLACAGAVSAQEFQNLSFENTDSSLFLWLRAPPELAIPGWGSNSGGLVGYNNLLDYYGAMLIYDSVGVAGYPFLSGLPLEGRFGFGMIPDAAIYDLNGNFNRRPPFIQQKGLVPAGSASLQFWFKGDIVQVSMNGQQLPLVQLGSGSLSPVGIINYAADIRPWAGQVATLKFAILASVPQNWLNWPDPVSGIDNIRFSITVIPEPSTGALLGLGLGGLAWARDRRRAIPPAAGTQPSAEELPRP